MFSCRRALAEPPFRQECLGRVEVTRVPMYAVRMKGKLRPFRYDSVNGLSGIVNQIDKGVPLQLAEYLSTLTLVY